MDKQKLFSQIEEITEEVIVYIDNLSEEKSNISIDGKWSINGNIDHLIKSIKPLSKALKVPKFLLKYKFGKMNREGRTYDEVYKKYKNALDANLAPSPNPFGPKEDEIFSKEELLSAYRKETIKLRKSLNSWSEKQLDVYVLPHPLIGRLSIREMLYFTHLHTNHHFETIKKINK